MIARMMSNMSMTKRLLIGTLLPLGVTFSILAVLLFDQLNKTVPPLLESTAQDRVEARADEVSQWLLGYERWLSGLARDSLLSIDSRDYVYEDWLRSRHTDDSAVESLFFVRKNGSAITHTGERVDVSKRDYFQQLVIDGTTEELLSDPVISKVSGEPTAVIGHVIYDNRGDRVGMLGATLTMAEMSRITSALATVEGSYGWAIDSSGMMVAHPEPDARMKINVTDADKHGYSGLDEHGRKFIQGEAGAGDIKNLDGETVRMIWSPIPNTPNWTVGVSIPKSAFTAPISRLLSFIGALVLCAFLGLAAILTLALRHEIKPIKQTAKAMEDIARGDGDLTQRLDDNRADELGELARQFNAFVNRMEETLIDVSHSTETVLNGAQDIVAHSNELASRSEQSAANLQETSASMEEITSTVTQTTDNAEQATQLSQQAATSTREGNEAMADVAGAMTDISSSATAINDIVTLIDNIAFQTNILALNASVEAARAGEHGRGFAVVAQEVRILASRSADAAGEIRLLVDSSVKHTENGARSVDAANSKMALILQNVMRVNDVIQEISSSAREQSAGIQQINTAVAELDTMTQQNAAMVQSSASNAESMHQGAMHLKHLLDGFNLRKEQRSQGLGAPTHRASLATPQAKRESPRLGAAVESDWDEF